MRTKQEWLKEVEDNLPKFKWFIEEKTYTTIESSIKEQNSMRVFDILNEIWFLLPDSFNIQNEDVMNRGWREFLSLIEFASGEEAAQILT